MFPDLSGNVLLMKWIEKLEKNCINIPILTHPTAYISHFAKVEKGCYVGAKAVVNTGTIVEKGRIIGIGALVDHDSYIKQYSYNCWSCS